MTVPYFALKDRNIYYIILGIKDKLSNKEEAFKIEKIKHWKIAVAYIINTKDDYLKLAKNPLMLIFAVGIFIYVGIEVGVATWISTFLKDFRGLVMVITRVTTDLSLFWTKNLCWKFSKLLKNMGIL